MQEKCRKTVLQPEAAIAILPMSRAFHWCLCNGGRMFDDDSPRPAGADESGRSHCSCVGAREVPSPSAGAPPSSRTQRFQGVVSIVPLSHPALYEDCIRYIWATPKKTRSNASLRPPGESVWRSPTEQAVEPPTAAGSQKTLVVSVRSQEAGSADVPHKCERKGMTLPSRPSRLGCKGFSSNTFWNGCR
jgi:hypothetical protein